jgi:hypothetical protein
MGIRLLKIFGGFLMLTVNVFRTIRVASPASREGFSAHLGEWK